VMSQNRKIIFQFQSVHWREDSITYEIGWSRHPSIGCSRKIVNSKFLAVLDNT
jgi:hypothetical protein